MNKYAENFIFCTVYALSVNVWFTKRSYLLKKETPTQAFSWLFCDIFKNILFHRTPPVAASHLIMFYKIWFEWSRSTKPDLFENELEVKKSWTVRLAKVLRAFLVPAGVAYNLTISSVRLVHNLSPCYLSYVVTVSCLVLFDIPHQPDVYFIAETKYRLLLNRLQKQPRPHYRFYFFYHCSADEGAKTRHTEKD